MSESEEISWVEFLNYENGQAAIKNSHLLIGTYTDTEGGVHPAMLMIVVTPDYVDLYVNIYGYKAIYNDLENDVTATVTITESNGKTEYLVANWFTGVDYLSLYGDYRDIFVAHLGKKSGSLLVEFHDAGWGIETASFVITRSGNFREAYESVIGK